MCQEQHRVILRGNKALVDPRGYEKTSLTNDKVDVCNHLTSTETVNTVILYTKGATNDGAGNELLVEALFHGLGVFGNGCLDKLCSIVKDEVDDTFLPDLVLYLKVGTEDKTVLWKGLRNEKPEGSHATIGEVKVPLLICSIVDGLDGFAIDDDHGRRYCRQ